MEKEFLVTKLSDQKKNKEYSFYRTLNIENGNIDLESFNKFEDMKSEDKNLAFFITSEIKYLSFKNPIKFYNNFLKTYKKIIDDNNFPQIYLRLVNDRLESMLELDGMDELNVVYLNNDNKRTK